MALFGPGPTNYRKPFSVYDQARALLTNKPKLTVRVVDFCRAVEVSREELFKKVKGIVKLLQDADNEEVLLNIVHGLFETSLES